MYDEEDFGTGNIFSDAFYNKIPHLDPSGENWLEFDRAVETCLILNGLDATMQQANEPSCPAVVAALPDDADEAVRAEHITKANDYKLAKKAYDLAIGMWEVKQANACYVIRDKCGTYNYTMIKNFKRVYDLMDALHPSPSTYSGRVMRLMNRFFTVTLGDCASVKDFSLQLSRINYEIPKWDGTPFTEMQLTLRFLHGLGPGYEPFMTIFDMSQTLIAYPGKDAITFDQTV